VCAWETEKTRQGAASSIVDDEKQMCDDRAYLQRQWGTDTADRYYLPRRLLYDATRDLLQHTLLRKIFWRRLLNRAVLFGHIQDGVSSTTSNVLR
jgi:hypothetical protein